MPIQKVVNVSSCMQSATASFHSARVIPKRPRNRSPAKREFFGLTAGCGNSELAIGVTLGFFQLTSCLPVTSSKMVSAKPHQLVEPPAVRLRIPDVKSVLAPLRAGTFYDERRRVSDVARPSWRTELVGHDTQLIALLRQPKHCSQEIVATRRIHPARTKNEIIARGLAYCMLAAQLAAPIGIDRIGQIIFCVGKILVAVENVIRGIVNKKRAQPPRFLAITPTAVLFTRVASSSSSSALSTAV